eukprot:2090664-Rhodomonas_salina.4
MGIWPSGPTAKCPPVPLCVRFRGCGACRRVTFTGRPCIHGGRNCERLSDITPPAVLTLTPPGSIPWVPLTEWFRRAVTFVAPEVGFGGTC